MKFIPLVWAGLWRKPLRTTLTTLVLVAAFTLFGLMEGINAGLVILRDIGLKENLNVVSRFNAPLTIGYREQIAQIPNVKRVLAMTAVGGTINGDPKRQAFILAAEDGYFDHAAQFDITPKQVAELSAQPNAFIATPAAAKNWGLKVGDRMILNGMAKADGTRDWAFDLIAIVDLKELKNVQQTAHGNFAYVNAERAQGKDVVNQFLVTVEDPSKALATAKAIEERFINSAVPMRAVNEGLAFEQQHDDNNLPEMMHGIVLSTLFALLFLTSNTIMQSFRERIPELGTLKAIGFSNRQVFGLVIAEAVVQCVTGAVIGLAIAPAIMPYAKTILKGQGATLMTFSWTVVGLGLLAAAAVAIISGTVPAFRAVRMTIVSALAVR